MTQTLRATDRSLLVKVPEITVGFWIAKLLTTAFGESASDYLVHAMPPVAAVLIGFVFFVAALVVQLRAPAYRPVVYWFAVAMVGVFGTMAADVLHVGFGVPYVVSTALFVVVLAAVFTLWHRVERTLSIHSIDTTRRELFYWAAVVATFAMGTALGDLAATTGGFGYLSSGLVFAGLIVVPALLFRVRVLGAVAAFWTAYVITRPLGASFADYFGVSKARGGLALGPGPVALVLGVALVVLVAVFARRHRRARR